FNETSALAKRLDDNLGLGSLMVVLPLLGQKDPLLNEIKNLIKELKDDIKAKANDNIASQKLLNYCFQF
ncbi:11500_t:CDS:2, partial [Gigaspora margarita]